MKEAFFCTFFVVNDDDKSSFCDIFFNHDKTRLTEVGLFHQYRRVSPKAEASVKGYSCIVCTFYNLS